MNHFFNFIFSITLLTSPIFASDCESESSVKAVKAVAAPEDLRRIWELYGEFVESLKTPGASDNSVLSYCQYSGMVGVSASADFDTLEKTANGGAYPPSLRDLTVDLPIEEIEDIFIKYGVIQLRAIDPTVTRLLLGCGNSPIDPHYYPGHHHQGSITINPQLSMNPSIVAGFGFHDLSGILPENHFTQLAEESTNPITYDGLQEQLERVTTGACGFFTVEGEKADGTDELIPLDRGPLEHLTDVSWC